MSTRIKREYKQIPLSQLELWKEGNVRKTDVFVDINDLAKSIQENNLQVPLLVYEKEANKKYLVISGQRRLEACRLINYDPVECMVLKNVSLDEAKVLSLSENLHRLPMNPDDIADACNYLLKRYNGKIELVAKHLGYSEPTVRKYLGWKHISPEIKELHKEHKITSSQAMRIHIQFPDKESQVKFAKELANLPDRMERIKFFEAIKEAKPTDDIPKVRERMKELQELKKYTIHLPPKTSIVIEKVALERNEEPQYIIIEIIEQWAENYEEGRESFS
ncbi:MAG: ParB/RepB/Spo0J family partition protein [Nitrososphaera sp.]